GVNRQTRQRRGEHFEPLAYTASCGTCKRALRKARPRLTQCLFSAFKGGFVCSQTLQRVTREGFGRVVQPSPSESEGFVAMGAAGVQPSSSKQFGQRAHSSVKAARARNPDMGAARHSLILA